jgi:hypothetical protein
MDMHDEQFERELNFEAELRQAMRRVDAPATLATRLAAAAEAENARAASGKAVVKRGRILAFPKPRVWFSGAIAAALLLGCLTLEGVHIQRQHERATADQQFNEAQQITNRTLEHARAQMQQQGISMDQF